MAHIKCPTDYIPLQQVTAANLNAHVNNAQLQPGAISDHAALPDPLASGDQFLVNDVSATPDELRSITAGAIFSSDLPITTSNLTTSTITGKAGANLNVTAPAGFNVNIASPITTTGVAVTGNGSVSGTLTVTSGIVTGDISSTGTANFTGTLQVNGTIGYVLTEIYEHTIPTFIAVVGGQFNNIYTSPAFTKPSGEIWVIEIQATHSGKGGYVYEFAVRYGSQTPTTGSYIGYERFHDGNGGGAHCVKTYLNRWVFQSSDTFTNETIRVDCNLGNGSEFQFAPTVWQYGGFVSNIMATPSKLRIYKYKTA